MSGNNPLVSVIMPAYNHELFIEETIRSLFNQTYQNLELIIIDDGSPDGTYTKMLELKPECEKRFVRVDFSTQENCGVSETVNRLLYKAKGEFIYSIATDDVAKPHAIETLVGFMINHDDYVLAVGDNEFINEHSQIIGWDKHRKSVDINKAQYKTFGAYLQQKHPDINFLSDQFGKYETFLQTNYIPNGFLTRKSVQTREKYTKDAPLEDLFLHLQMSKCGKYKYIDKVLLSYRIHDNNTFTKKDLMHKKVLKTWRYEQKLVHQKGMERWAEIFDKCAIQKKMKFHIGKMVQFYKLIDLEYKTNILEFFGHKFILKQKKR